MRLGLIVYGSLDELSGGFLYDRRMVEELQAMGHDVAVLALPWHRYGRALLDNLDRALFVRIAELQVDALLQDELCHPSLFNVNRRLRRLLDAPIYGIVHHLRSDEGHPALFGLLYRWVERRYLATLDGFIFNSEATRRSVEALLGDAANGVVAYPGSDHLTPTLDPRELAPMSRTPQVLRILFVGSLVRRKGLDLLLDAIAQLPAERWQLEIAGRADLEPRYAAGLRRRLAVEPFKSNARFHGPVQHADLDQLYRQADVLAVPSRYEGFGLVYLEAMGYGLPALASAAGGASELVEPGQQGILIEPGDVHKIRAALRTYIEEPDRLREHSAAAWRRYQDHPHWRESARSILRFLETDLPARPYLDNRKTGLEPRAQQRRRTT